LIRQTAAVRNDQHPAAALLLAGAPVVAGAGAEELGALEPVVSFARLALSRSLPTVIPGAFASTVESIARFVDVPLLVAFVPVAGLRSGRLLRDPWTGVPEAISLEDRPTAAP
jgi:hypothetical protein